MKQTATDRKARSFAFLSLLLFTALAPNAPAQSTITTVAGSGADNVSGTTANPGFAVGVAVDSSGNAYLPIADASVVLELNAATKELTVVAGTGVAGYSGDNGSATKATLNGPLGVALDSSGNIYIADAGNNRVRRVSKGTISTVAGNGRAGYSGDGGSATKAEVNAPLSVTLDAVGNLYILETCAGCIVNIVRKVSQGIISTIAGGESGVYIDSSTVSIASDPSGNIFWAEPAYSNVWELSGGETMVVAGSEFGESGYGGDGGPATNALLNTPKAVELDSTGNLYIADTGNNRIREVSNGIINTIAGNGKTGAAGDGGKAIKAELFSPAAVGIGSNGTFFIADSGNQLIREVSAGIISSVVGGIVLPSDGDNIPAITATLAMSPSVAVDASGNIYIAETGTHRIRKVSGGIITTVAGNGTQGYSGDGGSATNAQLNGPLGLAVTSSGDIYIADTGNNVVRRVSGGTIATVAGNGKQGYSGDGGKATKAKLKFPAGVALDSTGNLYIADTGNWAIRKVSAGIITTYLGNSCCFPTAGLNSPTGLAVDAAGNLYIADTGDHRIRQVSPNGTVTTVAGLANGPNGFSQRGYNGDNIPAASAELNFPTGIALDSSGNLYIADSVNQRIRKVSAGTITTVAGTGKAGYGGDGGSPTKAKLTWPSGIAVDAIGNLYIADTGNKRIRKISPAAPIPTSKRRPD